MRIRISIDDTLLEAVKQKTHQNDVSAAIRTALEQYLKHARKGELLALRGTVPIDDGWKTLRQLDTKALPSAAPNQ